MHCRISKIDTKDDPDEELLQKKLMLEVQVEKIRAMPVEELIDEDVHEIDWETVTSQLYVRLQSACIAGSPVVITCYINI